MRKKVPEQHVMTHGNLVCYQDTDLGASTSACHAHSYINNGWLTGASGGRERTREGGREKGENGRRGREKAQGSQKKGADLYNRKRYIGTVNESV